MNGGLLNRLRCPPPLYLQRIPWRIRVEGVHLPLERGCELGVHAEGRRGVNASPVFVTEFRFDILPMQHDTRWAGGGGDPMKSGANSRGVQVGGSGTFRTILALSGSAAYSSDGYRQG